MYRNVVELSQAATGPSNSAKGDTFVQDQSVLVLLLELDLVNGGSEATGIRYQTRQVRNAYGFRQVSHRTVLLEDTFSHDDPTRQRPPLLPALLVDALKNLLKILQVIVIVPTNSRTGDLKTLLDGELDTAVGDDDISTLRERWNDKGNRRKVLRVQDRSLGTQKLGNITLEVHMYV